MSGWREELGAVEKVERQRCEDRILAREADQYIKDLDKQETKREQLLSVCIPPTYLQMNVSLTTR